MAALWTFTFTVTLWANHIQFAPITSVPKLLRAVIGVARDVALIALLMIPAALALPAFGCYTNRAHASEVINRLSTAKLSIAQRAKSLGTVEGSGEGLSVITGGRLAIGHVLRDGVLIGVGEDPPVVFVLTPRIVGAEVAWQCTGLPKEVVPLQCRPE